MLKSFFIFMLNIVFILYILGVIIISCFGFTLIGSRTIIYGILLLLCGVFLSFTNKKFQIIGIIFVIINFLYIVFTAYKDSLMFAKFDTLKLSFNIGISVTIYYLLIFILKNLYVEYSKKKLEIEK